MIFEATVEESAISEEIKPISYYNKARELLRFLDEHPEVLTNIQDKNPEEKTRYKAPSKLNYKPRGGKPTIDFTATELKVDLGIALAKKDYPELLRCFFGLSRILGY